MKPKSFILILLTIFFISCRNEDVYNSSVIGKWNWISTSGGIAGVNNTPESTGKISVVEFTKDSICKNYENGILISERVYHVKKNSDDFTEYPYILKYDNNDFGFHFAINDNQLIFNDTFIDGFMSIYMRIN